MSVGGRTRVGAVIGWPVEHSKSPALHNAAFAASGLDAVFVALPVRPGEVAAAVRGLAALGFLGASVTVPHKEAALGACDRLAAPADRIGAVNCLVFEDGAVVGHNTDAGGFVDALREAVDLDPRDAPVILLGAGGAARAVHAGLTDAGARVEVVARNPARCTWTRALPWDEPTLATSCRAAALLVDCTSTGLSPAAEAELPAPVPVDLLPASAVVTTLVYHRTPALLAAAAARGLRTFDGAGMLVHQGARAFRLWTKTAPSLEAMWRAMRPAPT